MCSLSTSDYAADLLSWNAAYQVELLPLPVRMAQVAAMVVSNSCSQVALSLVSANEQPKVCAHFNSTRP